MFDWFRRTKGSLQDRRRPYCSFCQKSYLIAGPLAAGHGETYICRDCVRLCGTIIDRAERQESVARN
jgi:hypothetical protein